MEAISSIGESFGFAALCLVALSLGIWKTVTWSGERLLGDQGIVTKVFEKHLETLAEFRVQMTQLTQVQNEILREIRDIPCRPWNGEERRRSGDTRGPGTEPIVIQSPPSPDS